MLDSRLFLYTFIEVREMKWKKYNPNPGGKQVGDCTVRAIARALDVDWDTAYLGICLQGLVMCDMPSANAVWGAYLKKHGFKRHMLPEECPDCYTLEKFCEDHPKGCHVVAFGSHVVAVVDGCYHDTWESGQETPVYYFSKEGE